MRRTVAVLIACAAALGAPRGADGQGGWSRPACSAVAGTDAVTFTRDEGRTLAPTAGELRGVAYTFGLVALDAPNALVAEHDGAILRSSDAGCTWSELGRVESFPLTLVAAPGGLAYGFADNGSALVRIGPDGVRALASPAESIVGLGVDRADASRLRLGDGSGAVWESADGGGAWSRLGRVPVAETIVYRVAFDPSDLDHVVVGTAVSGAFVSVDGAETWRPATGLAEDGRANVFNVVVSPARGSVVWAMGLALAELDAGAPSGGRHVYRSTDGGLTFKAVVRQSRRVTLVNGPVMAAHPTKAGVLYFVFGTYFQSYGTDVYRYDARTKKVTKTHNDYDDVSSIAFNPADPSVMYFGLTVEEISGR